jgi:hypothetical protein
MRLSLALVLLASFAAPVARGAPQDVATELRRYYEDGQSEPAWQGALERLTSDTEEQRTAAADYLRDLLAQALKDEQSGTARWRATPFWGSSGENPARELRERIAESLAKAPASAAALPVVRWYLEHELLARLQVTALAAAVKVEGQEADTLLVGLAAGPHVNAGVVAGAFDAVARRKLPIPAEKLAPLYQHHRRQIREAARAAGARLGLPKPPDFDPDAAMRSEPVRRLLAELGPLLLEQGPADARFVKAVTSFNERHDWTEHGWLVSEDKVGYLVLTKHGELERYWKAGHGRRATRIEDADPEGWVDHVVAARAGGNKNFELSAEGGLTGQFEGRQASLAEIVLALRLVAAGHQDQAARVFLPALDTLLLDQHLVDLARDRLGDVYGHQMLLVFANDRDYDDALKFARHITEHLKGTRFSVQAARMLDELPRRRDDFNELRLPTPEEWAVEKNRLSRAERIDYLCRRLRLLNCYQHSQPGGISFFDRQYAEPRSATEPRTEVINPYAELVGNAEDPHWKNVLATSVGMGLTAADVAQLSEHLRDDWYMPSVSYWRDFAPERTVHHTREIVAELIHSAAWCPLCDVRNLDEMTPEEQAREIDRVRGWCWWIALLRKAFSVGLVLGVLAAFVAVVRKVNRARRPVKQAGEAGTAGLR